jgi:hypothetical protein
MRRRLSRAAKKKPHPKTKLGLPDLDQAKAAVLGSLHSPESQRGYQHSINEWRNGTNPISVGSRFGANNGEVSRLQAATARSCQRRIGIEPAP